MKKWLIQSSVIPGAFSVIPGLTRDPESNFIQLLLKQRGFVIAEEQNAFLHPQHPSLLTPADVGIDQRSLDEAIARIQKAIADKESIVVYADYDADGITSGAILWETLHALGANAMPYIPHRVEEGYGLSVKGIDSVVEKHNPTLIITVDNGISAKDKVKYALEKGIDVIITDHHVKPVSAPDGPEELPECTIVHTTSLCGAGVSWFLSKELLRSIPVISDSSSVIPISPSVIPAKAGIQSSFDKNELLALAAIGTIADLVPLVGANRAIVKFGLASLNETKRVGLKALMQDAGITPGELSVYDVSHTLAPRLNAMGRLVHAMDALRLLCTKQEDKAMLLARTLGLTNKERQQMTIDMTTHALQFFQSTTYDLRPKILFVAHESYNQGVIGLVAGKLVEEYYRPAIVIAKGELVSKASARSISGFNIIEAIRACSDILVDAGGHPMAAGFTVETKNLEALQKRLEQLAEEQLDEEKLTRVLKIDAEVPLEVVTEELWSSLQDFQPFGFGNPEPVFASRDVTVSDIRLIGNGNKHLKLRVASNESSSGAFDTRNSSTRALGTFEAVAFNMGELYGQLSPNSTIDIAYTLDMNHWNGRSSLQLKLRDIHLPYFPM